MKGFMIYETPAWGDEENVVYAQEVNHASYTLKWVGTNDIMCYLEGVATEEPITKARCNKEDTYDFEIGALIALMKMCGVDKVVRACNEAFSEDTFKTYATKYERELNELKKDFDKVKDLKDFYKKNYNERLEEIKELKSDKDKTWKNYQRKIQKKQDRINELEAQITASEDDKQKNIEYYEKEIKRLNSSICAKGILNNKLLEENKNLKDKIGLKTDAINELKLVLSKTNAKIGDLVCENEKLKLDCEKLKYGYNDTDMTSPCPADWDGDVLNIIFLPGRACGKQYTALVNLFKKIDQKKVDAAYKEAYNTTLPVWQKEVLRQVYDIRKESKEKTELPRTLDINGLERALKDFGEQITKLAEEKIKPLTKREEMWDNILGVSKCPPVEIKVAKEDITTFLRELQDKIPEARWNGSDCPPVKLSIPNWFKHDYIYFALFRNDDKGNLRMCYDDKPHSWINKPVIEYIAPMRWDLFEKGRIYIRVKAEHFDEFQKACKAHLECGKVPLSPFRYYSNGDVIVCYTDEHFRLTKTLKGFKKRPVVNWEDVR